MLIFARLSLAMCLGLMGVGPGCAPEKAAQTPAPADALPTDLADLRGADGATIYNKVCAQCHGAKGEGNAALRAPSMAGMPAWYTRPQIEKFRTGVRGSDPVDPAGYLMRAIAVQLDEAMIEAVCRHVETFEPVRTANTLAGDPVEGKYKFGEYCMRCHRYNASGELVFGSPPLTRLPDWYMAEQLRKFNSGLRGAHPQDLKGAKMAEVVSFLERPEDIRDILAYIATLADRYEGAPADRKR